MVEFAGTDDQFGGSTLKSLESGDELLRYVDEQGVDVVDVR